MAEDEFLKSLQKDYAVSDKPKDDEFLSGLKSDYGLKKKESSEEGKSGLSDSVATPSSAGDGFEVSTPRVSATTDVGDLPSQTAIQKKVQEEKKENLDILGRPVKIGVGDATKTPTIGIGEITPPNTMQSLEHPQKPLTVGEYLTSAGVSPEQVGLSPDFNIDKNITQYEYDAINAQLGIKEKIRKQNEIPEESSYWWGAIKNINIGTAKVFRDLNGAERLIGDVISLTGLPKSEGVFGKVADYIEKNSVEGVPDVPDNIIGEVIRQGGQLEGLFLEMLAPVNPGLTKLPIILGTSGALNTYGELSKQNAPLIDRVKKTAEAFDIGFGQGAVFTLMGIGGGKLNEIILNKTGSALLGYIGNLAINSGGFAGITALEQVAAGEPLDRKQIISSALLGGVLTVPQLAGIVWGNDVNRAINTSDQTIKNIDNAKIDPIKVLNKIEEIDRKIELGKTKQGTKDELTSAKTVLENILTTNAGIQMIKENPSAVIGAIKESDLTETEKKISTDKINSIVAETDPKLKKVKPLSDQIGQNNEKIAEIEGNKFISDEVKQAQKKPLEEENKVLQSEIDAEFVPKEEPVAEKPQKPSETETKGKEITPEKKVSASKQSAIKDVLTIDKYKDIKEMEAGMLSGKFSKGERVEVPAEGSLTETTFKSLEKKGLIEEDFNEGWILTPKGKEFLDAVEARAQTRKGVKEGTDLFPEEAAIPEVGQKEKVEPKIKEEPNYAKEQQSGTVRTEGTEVRKIEGVSDKDLPSIDRTKLQDREKVQEKVKPPIEKVEPPVETEKINKEKTAEEKLYDLQNLYAKRGISISDFDKMAEPLRKQITGKEKDAINDIRKEIELSKKQPIAGLWDKIDAISSESSKRNLMEEYSKANSERVSSEIKQNKSRAKKVVDAIDNPPPKQELNIGDEVVENSFVGKEQLKKIQRFMKKSFTSAGLMPRVLFDLKIKKDARIKTRIERMNWKVKLLHDAVKNEYGKLEDKTKTEIDEALHDPTKIQNLMPETGKRIRELRNEIDEMTNELLNLGVLEGDIVVTLSNNLGAYVTRSYKVHDNPKKWLKNIPQEYIDRARTYIINQFSNKGITLTEAELDGVINSILRDSDVNLLNFSSRKEGAVDVGILIRRKEISQEIRDLLGEWHNPFINIIKTQAKMIAMIENYKFLQEVADIGKGKYFFDRETGENFVQIATTESMKPIKGLFTTPDIKEAFEHTNKEVPKWVSAWMTINGVAKYGKTILSPITHVRNFTANFLLQIGNGRFNPKYIMPTLKTMQQDLFPKNADEGKRMVLELVERSVLHDVANAGEIRAVINDIMGVNGVVEKFYENRMKKYAKSTLRVVERLYQAEDDFHKAYAYYYELGRLKKAYKENSKFTEDQLKNKAAYIVRQTMPTYSLVPEAIKELRRIPLVGSFVSFPAEIFRTSFNIIDISFKEMSIKETKWIGAQRLSGFVAALAIPSLLSQYSNQKHNITVNDDEYLREFVPKWSENSNLLVLSKDIKNGVITYIDLSYSDPYNYVKKGAMAALRGDQNEKIIYEAVSEYFRPFLGEEIMTAKMLDVARNKDDKGGSVYNKQDLLGDQIADVFLYMWKGAEPGVVTTVKRMFDDKKDWRKELMATGTGLRISTIDIPQSIKFDGKRYENDVQDAKSIYFKKSNPEWNSSKDIVDAYTRSNSAYQRLFMMFSNKVNAAKKLGISEEQIIRSLTDAGLSNKEIINVLDNNFEPFFPSNDERALDLLDAMDEIGK